MRGFQLKRWYSAEMPKSSIDVSTKTADAHFAGGALGEHDEHDAARRS